MSALSQAEAAAIDTPPTPAVTYKSDGVTVVYGRDETAIDAAPVMLANRIKTWLEEHA